MTSPLQSIRSRVGGLLTRGKMAFAERSSLRGSMQNISLRIRRPLTVLTVGYFLLLVPLLGVVRYRGESNWFFSAILFLPATFWLLPLLVLTPIHLIFRPWLCSFTLGTWALVSFLYLNFCWSFSPEDGDAGLTVLTNNIGERDLRTLGPFLLKERPDVIAMQEIWAGGNRDWRQEFPDRFYSVVGECALVSRFPILKSSYSVSIGPRFELDYRGRHVVIYVVHLPSPRSEFRKLRGRGLIRELIGGGGFYSKKSRDSYSRFVERKIKMSRAMIAALRKESLPFLIVGDFNMPSNGRNADLFRSEFSDAFQQCGLGLGNTFPGWSDNRLADLFGPWLRLDYLFAGKEWEPVMCRVEPRVPAQHLAVVARFKLRSEAHNP